MWLHQLVFGLVLSIVTACGAALLYFSEKWDREAEDRARRAGGFPPAEER